MGLKHIAISAVAVTAMVCAYADVEWKIYADGYPNEYGVVSRNIKNPAVLHNRARDCICIKRDESSFIQQV